MKNLKGQAWVILALGISSPVMAEEYSAFQPIVEINATDGDVGFHVLVDGDGWKRLNLFNPDGDRILRVKANSNLREQGVTELFFESAEPPCWFDDEDPEADEDEVVTVEDFLDRFEAGTYVAKGRTIDGIKLASEATLSHNLPAAPETDVEIDEDEVTISWSGGDDLGMCAYPETIPAPGDVEVVRWEVVVEPNEDELPGGELPAGVVFAKFTVQLPSDVDSVEVPEEFIRSYLEAGVTEFKGEVGAREAGGNQTFTEFEFSVDDDDEEEE